MLDFDWIFVLFLNRSTHSSMFIGSDVLFTVSFSVNICVIIFCAASRLHDTWRGKTSSQSCSDVISTCNNLDRTQKIHELSKIVTEQVAVLVAFCLGVVSVCATDLVRVPFSGRLDHNDSTFVQIVLSINVGRYVYLTFQDVYLMYLIEKTKFRTDLVHHVVTVISYSIIVAYQENMLLGIIGMISEMSTAVIQLTKILKTLKRHKTAMYRRMSLVTCVVTIAFRGVIPVLFLVMGMLHETPFVMHYTTLTVFFLSIIFFSVINVWLILSSVQRVVRVLGYSESIVSNCQSNISPSQPFESFRKNNLGYERPLGNINISYDMDKLNLNKNIDQNLISKIPAVHFTNSKDDNDDDSQNSNATVEEMIVTDSGERQEEEYV